MVTLRAGRPSRDLRKHSHRPVRSVITRLRCPAPGQAAESLAVEPARAAATPVRPKCATRAGPGGADAGHGDRARRYGTALGDVPARRPHCAET